MPDRRLISLLRGINVGGHRRVPMAQLAALYADLGFEDVRTYIQSGNVIFSGNVEPASAERLIARGIAKLFGFEVSVMVRSGGEWSEIVEQNPFAGSEAIDANSKSLVVTFLSEAPLPERVDAARDVDSGEDQFVVMGREIYTHCSYGYGVTVLSNGFFEEQLGVRGTTRNWRTVNRIAALV